MHVLVAIAWCVMHGKVQAHTDDPAALVGVESLRWSWDPLVLSLLAVSAALYLRGIHALWHRSGSGSGVSTAQAICFWIGWLTLLIALVSPLDPLGEVLFSAHMVQHELLMVLAAPLLVLGRPLAVFVWALPLPWRRLMGVGSKSVAVAAPWRLLTNPLVAWMVHAGVLWAWHIPGLFQASIRNASVHTAQHFSFLLAALFFWWALLQTRARHGGDGMAILYLLTTAIHTAMLGALLTFSQHAWYPAYAATTPAWGLTPLEDQQLGGLIMWVPGGLFYLVAALWLVARLLRASAASSEQHAAYAVQRLKAPAAD